MVFTLFFTLHFNSIAVFIFDCEGLCNIKCYINKLTKDTCVW